MSKMPGRIASAGDAGNMQYMNMPLLMLALCGMAFGSASMAEICRSTGTDGVIAYTNDCGTSGKRRPSGYIYHYKRADDVIYLTNVPDRSLKLISKRAYYSPKGWSDAPTNSARWRPNTKAYADLIQRYARRYGVDPSLVRAVIHAESNFDPQAISPKGAVGLMQLMPATAARFGVSDRRNPEQNVHGGVAYLRLLLDMFDNDTRLAVAAYNAGENAVKRFSGIPPYAETQNYVDRVMMLYARYRNLQHTAAGRG